MLYLFSFDSYDVVDCKQWEQKLGTKNEKSNLDDMWIKTLLNDHLLYLCAKIT